jgi:hypothetical protein
MTSNEAVMNKKELISQYKNTPRRVGVFQIKNNANGKVLVESSLNLDGRRNRFEFEVAQGCVIKNRDFEEDWKQFGAASFSFEVLEEVKASDDPKHDYWLELTELEQKWLVKLQPYGERGYNRLPTKK